MKQYKRVLIIKHVKFKIYSIQITINPKGTGLIWLIWRANRDPNRERAAGSRTATAVTHHPTGASTSPASAVTVGPPITKTTNPTGTVAT